MYRIRPPAPFRRLPRKETDSMCHRHGASLSGRHALGISPTKISRAKPTFLPPLILISLFCFAASAAAQTPGSGPWKTPQQWFHDQRAYPLGFIPAESHARALRQLDQVSAGHDHGNEPQWKPLGPMPTQFPLGGSIDNYVNFPIRGSGKIDALAVDPRNANVVYLGSSDGGVWKTIDEGAHWTQLFDEQDSLSIGSIALDPQNPDTIYVGSGAESESFLGIGVYGDGIYKSSNGGSSWQHFDGSNFGAPLSNYSGDGGARVVSIAVHPKNRHVLLAGVKFSDCTALPASGIWRSVDGGSHWTQVLGSDFGGQVVFDPTAANTAYAVLNTSFCAATAGADGLYKSTDGGVTWTPILSYPFGSYLSYAIAPSNPQTIYVLSADPAVLKSADGGLNWSAPLYNQDFCGDQCGYDQVIAIDPVDPNIVFIGGELYVHRSLDGGVTWQKVDGRKLHVDHHALAFSADGSVLYDGNDGGVWSTADISNPSSIPWTELNETLSLTQFYPGISLDPTNTNVAFGGSQDNGLQKYSGGPTWNGLLLDDLLNSECGDGFRTLVDFNHPQTVYATCLTGVAGLFLWRSESGGDPLFGTLPSFHLLRPCLTPDSLCPPNDRGLNFASPLNMDPSDSRRLYTAGYQVWRSDDRGDTWSTISPPLSSSYPMWSMAVAPGDPNTVYTGATGNGILYRTSNALAAGGASWTDITSTALPDRLINAIAVDPLN